MAPFTQKTRPPAGQALVEFALLGTVLITLVLGIFDFGRAYYTQVQIKNAVGDAGYYAIQNPGNDTGTKNRITQQLSGLNPALSNSNIAITCSSGITKIRVDYQYHFVFSWLVPSAQVSLGDETYVPQINSCP